jgi:hypothetical protein
MPGGPEPAPRCPLELRQRWCAATIDGGWPYPSDWGLAAVDAVCEAVAEGRDPVPALERLGRARAQSGAGLSETLHDLAAFHATLAGCPPGVDSMPAALIRAAALGWAEATAGELASNRVVDGLTGLATTGYLRTRLGEVYRSAEACGQPAGERHVLVLLAVDLSRTVGWARLVPMLLAAEAMRAVFTGGETHALVGPSVAAVLCRRDPQLPLRTKRLRRLVTELLAADADAAHAGPVRLWLERLPPTYPAACDLLSHLGR